MLIIFNDSNKKCPAFSMLTPENPQRSEIFLCARIEAVQSHWKLAPEFRQRTPWLIKVGSIN